MIYATEERAKRIADELNRVPGYPRAQAILTKHGWTVVRDYKFGRSGNAR